MNVRSLYPPINKSSIGSDLPKPQSQIAQGKQTQPVEPINPINLIAKEGPKNQPEKMKIPNLSLAESPAPNDKKKQVVHEHLRSDSDNRDNLQDNPLAFLLNVAMIQRQSQQLKNNREAEEEFSKKFKRMYQFPASVREALIHRRAYRNGFNSSQSIIYLQSKQNRAGQQTKQELFTSETLLCPCCQNFVNTVEIPLCYSTYPKKQYETSAGRSQVLQKATNGKHKEQNAFLFKGGDSLFFCFVKLLITFLLLKCVIMDGFNLYTNYMGTYCRTHKAPQQKLCTKFYVSILSTYNNATTDGQASLEHLDMMSLLMTVVSILFCFYGRIKLYELYWYTEKRGISEDDYTILIENIPPIPFLGNDSLVKDVNQEYRSFIKKLVSNKIKIWLNSFFSYESEEQIADKVDREFYKIFNKNKDESDLFENIVTQVSLCYDLTELENLQNFRQNLVQHFLQQEGDKQAVENSLFDDQVAGEKSNNIGRQYIAYLPHQIEIINQHYVQLCEKISDAIVLKTQSAPAEEKQVKGYDSKPLTEMKISRFVGKAFVSFQYEHYKRYLLQKYAQDKDYFKVNGNTVRLTLSHAQKPNDVYWKNMKVSDEFRRRQVRNSYILVLVALLMSTSIMYILRSVQSHIVNGSKDKRTSFEEVILNSIPLWTFLVNHFLDWGIFQLTQSERHKTKTEELSSLIVKNTAAKFINTSVIYALIFIFGERVNPMKENGLVNTIFDLVYVNAVLNIVLEFLQPAWLIADWSNSKYLQKDRVSVFQIKLNKMMEMPSFDFAQAYSYYLQMVYICSFYGYLLPAITPMLLIAFSVQFWVDKYNLTRRCSSPIDMGYFLTELTWKAFEMSILLFVLGHLIWGNFFYQKFNTNNFIFNSVNVFLGLAYVAFVNFCPEVTQKLTLKFASESGLSQEAYDQIYSKFQKTYRAQNPATSFLNKTDDEIYASKDTNKDIIAEAVKQMVGVRKRKLKSEIFVPVDSAENKQKLKEIIERDDEFTLKCEEESDPNFQGFKTALCCL